jgi:hypothetical protein
VLALGRFAVDVLTTSHPLSGCINGIIASTRPSLTWDEGGNNEGPQRTGIYRIDSRMVWSPTLLCRKWSDFH